MEFTAPLKPKVELIDPNWTLKGPDDNMFFEHTQDINDDFLSQLRDRRTASPNSRSGEFELAAEVPTAVVDKWAREGFDIQRESWKNIRSRLIREDLGVFITSAKAL